jgi:hypothetical protein
VLLIECTKTGNDASEQYEMRGATYSALRDQKRASGQVGKKIRIISREFIHFFITSRQIESKGSRLKYD